METRTLTKRQRYARSETQLQLGIMLFSLIAMIMLDGGCDSRRQAPVQDQPGGTAEPITTVELTTADEPGTTYDEVEDMDLREEAREIDEWYGDPNTIGPRPLPDHSDEFYEDDETEGGCYELPPELNCEPTPELEEFCFELSEEDVELLYQATQLLQEAFEAEAFGDCCLALEKLGELAGMVTEESIISNLLTIRLMAQIQGDLTTVQAAEALLGHLGYGMTDLGMFLFEIPIDPSFGQPSPTDIPEFNFPPNQRL